MKKVTKQRIGVLIVASIFFMSTIAYVFTIAVTPTEEEEALEEFVIEGELDPAIENEYLRVGFTIMKLYNPDQGIISYADSLPNYLKTNNNQIQLIVEKIPSNETYAVITGPYGEEELTNVTSSNIFNTLCEILLVTPLECGYEEIGNVTANTTSNTTS
jgi:hypothetical protein